MINETLRLYPPAYLTARECIADVEIGGHVIKKGTLVLLSQWEQQREPTIFEDADEFRPDRWSAAFRSIWNGVITSRSGWDRACASAAPSPTSSSCC